MQDDKLTNGLKTAGIVTMIFVFFMGAISIFFDNIAGNFKVGKQADYIALNLTIIEILLVIIALLVAGVSVFGFFKVTEIAKARVEWYLEEIDLPTMLEPRIRDIITEKKDEWIGQALNQSEDIRNPDSEVENETQNDTG